MLPIRKFQLGLRTAKKMFRLDSLWGELLDELGALHGGDSLEVGIPPPGMFIEGQACHIIFPDDNILVRVGIADIFFSRDGYSDEVPINAEKTLQRFEQVWTVVNRVMQVRDVRRIGIVAEHRRKDVDSPTQKLLSALTKMNPLKGHKGFNLRFEQILPDQVGKIPDVRTEPFCNVISAIYDSNRDEVPEDGAINVNIDVQRYFNPLLQRNVMDEAKALFRKEFTDSWRALAATAQSLGVLQP